MRSLIALSLFSLASTGFATVASAHPDHEERRERKEERRERKEERHEERRDERREFRNEHGPGWRVRAAPPAVRAEMRGSPPSPRHVWVGGYWGWEGGRHVWMPGRWELPPSPGQVWVDARWANEGGEFVFHPGFWNVTVAAPPPVYTPPAEITIGSAPPPPRPEVMSPQPSPNHFWIAGDWTWDGRQYVWGPGHWEVRRAGWEWVPPHWDHRGRQAIWRPGHWRR